MLVSLELRPSFLSLLYFSGLYALSCVAVMLSALPVVVKVLLTLGLLGHGMYRLYTLMIGRLRRGVEHLYFDTESCFFVCKDGERALLGECLVWSWLVVMHFRGQLSGKKHVIVVLPDSCSNREYKYLKAWLRYRPTAIV